MILSNKFRTILPVSAWPDVADGSFEPKAD